MTTLTHFYDHIFDVNRLRFPAMMKISTFCSNIADDRFISGLILKIEGLKIHCHTIDVYLFTRIKYNSVIYCDTRYAWMPPSWILPVNYGTALSLFEHLFKPNKNRKHLISCAWRPSSGALKIKLLESQIFVNKSLGARKPKSLNIITKIG